MEDDWTRLTTAVPEAEWQGRRPISGTKDPVPLAVVPEVMVRPSAFSRRMLYGQYSALQRPHSAPRSRKPSSSSSDAAPCCRPTTTSWAASADPPLRQRPPLLSTLEAGPRYRRGDRLRGEEGRQCCRGRAEVRALADDGVPLHGVRGDYRDDDRRRHIALIPSKCPAPEVNTRTLRTEHSRTSRGTSPGGA